MYAYIELEVEFNVDQIDEVVKLYLDATKKYKTAQKEIENIENNKPPFETPSIVSPEQQARHDKKIK